MAYTRPHEDRLGTGGGTPGDALLYTGTGTAEYGPASGSFTPVVMYAECTTPPTGTVDLDWTAFYDVDEVDTSMVIPAGMGFTYSAGDFTLTEDGIWLLDLGVRLVQSPGSGGGTLGLIVPSMGLSPEFVVAAANTMARWQVSRTVVGHTGDQFYVTQAASVALIDTLCTLDIVRIADSLS